MGLTVMLQCKRKENKRRECGYAETVFDRSTHIKKKLIKGSGGDCNPNTMSPIMNVML